MEDSRKPLTAVEIEEMKALEAKATPGEWVSEPCHKGESCWCRAIGVVGDEDNYVAPSGCLSTDDAAFVAAVRNVLPRLLSMLTPPTDAAVREAVEELERKLAWLRSHPKEESANVGIVQLRIDLDILLHYVRAVQTPRLTVEQVECLKNTHIALTTNCLEGAAWELRAVFPEAFGEEE